MDWFVMIKRLYKCGQGELYLKEIKLTLAKWLNYLKKLNTRYFQFPIWSSIVVANRTCLMVL